MRPILSLSLIVFAILTLIACKDTSTSEKEEKENEVTEKIAHQEGSENLPLSFKEEEKKTLFLYYRKIKRALINSSLEEAQTESKKFLTETSNTNEKVKILIEKIAYSNTLKEQRLYFSELSLELESYLIGSTRTGVIYKQYCPMAFGGKGGFWLSKDKEIMNPYYGDKMLHCGSNKEAIR